MEKVVNTDNRRKVGYIGVIVGALSAFKIYFKNNTTLRVINEAQRGLGCK